MSEKMKKAEYLFCELSGIDERIAAEAMEESGREVRRTPKRAFVILAAALLLISVTVGSFLIGNLEQLDDADGKEATSSTFTLTDALEKAQSSDRVMSYKESEDVELFDGVTRIVWKDDGEYRAIALRGTKEEKELDRAMALSFKNALSVSGTESELTPVWISYGDGRVVTPYLKDSVGNVGYGELFDYDAEMIPSNEMTELVESLVS